MTKVTGPTVAERMYWLTSMRFTVPAGVPAATVMWPTMLLPPPRTWKFAATGPAGSGPGVTAKPAVAQEAPCSPQIRPSVLALVGDTPTSVSVMFCFGGTDTASCSSAMETELDGCGTMNCTIATEVVEPCSAPVTLAALVVTCRSPVEGSACSAVPLTRLVSWLAATVALECGTVGTDSTEVEYGGAAKLTLPLALLSRGQAPATSPYSPAAVCDSTSGVPGGRPHDARLSVTVVARLGYRFELSVGLVPSLTSRKLRTSPRFTVPTAGKEEVGNLGVMLAYGLADASTASEVVSTTRPPSVAEMIMRAASADSVVSMMGNGGLLLSPQCKPTCAAASPPGFRV